MTTTDQQIHQNVEDARDAALLIEMAGDQRPRFWETVARLAQENLPPSPKPAERLPAFTDQEAIRFETMTMPWGNHYGKCVGEVPCEYLLFVTEGDEFSQRLKRYVKSKRFQERQGDQ